MDKTNESEDLNSVNENQIHHKIKLKIEEFKKNEIINLNKRENEIQSIDSFDPSKEIGLSREYLSH